LRVLEAFVTDPRARVGQIELLDEYERHQILSRVDVCAAVEARTLPQLLAQAVTANPDGCAVRYGQQSLTYRELDERANRVARVLIDQGVGPEDLVAIAIDRSVESVLAVWAVAKTGAAFVPVDPGYPASRIAYMLEDSWAAVGITTSARCPGLPQTLNWMVLDETDTGVVDPRPVTDTDRVTPVRIEHPAYVIYTSGSTGRPKGVAVTHTGLANFATALTERFSPDICSRVLQVASPSFDASIHELLLAVGAAATLIVAPADVYAGPELTRLLQAERITHLVATPQVLISLDPVGIDELRVVAAAGEACPPELVKRWAGTDPAGRREFFNSYGPTESTVWVSGTRALSPDGVVSIGAPIAGVGCLVLDAWLRPVPVGVAGELYVSGVQLARGYVGRA
ncbi:AMP-binding protein, partial [Nocardia vinacea]|uniref:AMP-binding protein n=1 Tax=Nocardia vinacea TaxID=96468 RepID=UPI0033D125B8